MGSQFIITLINSANQIQTLQIQPRVVGGTGWFNISFDLASMNQIWLGESVGFTSD